jgi:anti-anti-sigma factor
MPVPTKGTPSMTQPPSRYYAIETLPKASVIDMRLDATLDVQAFNEITEQLIDRWPIDAGRDVLVDLTRSHFSGSIVLGLLINIRTRARAGGGELIVVAASPGLIQVCRTANLDRLIVMVPTRAQALARL